MQREIVSGEASIFTPSSLSTSAEPEREEIARLPEKIRLAVVLCDLQGIPQEQAAESLRLSERTLRRRLADGRARLKARLGCRGMGCSGTIQAEERRMLRPAPPLATGMER